VIDIESRNTVKILTSEDINKNLIRRRLNSKGEPLDNIEPNFDNPMEIKKIIKSALDDKEICNIKGKIQLTRVKFTYWYHINNYNFR
jgi:hypothetical protein